VSQKLTTDTSATGRPKLTCGGKASSFADDATDRAGAEVFGGCEPTRTVRRDIADVGSVTLEGRLYSAVTNGRADGIFIPNHDASRCVATYGSPGSSCRCSRRRIFRALGTAGCLRG
jgi:hypothetical protein